MNRSVTYLTTIGIFFFIAMMLTIVMNVITRAFDKPILGTQEAVEMMMTVTGGFALGYCALKQGHVVIRILIDHISPSFRKVFAIITSILGLAIWLLIAWQSVEFGIEQFHIDERTTIMEWPLYPVRFIFAFGFFVFSAVLLLDLFKLIKSSPDDVSN